MDDDELEAELAAEAAMEREMYDDFEAERAMMEMEMERDAQQQTSSQKTRDATQVAPPSAAQDAENAPSYLDESKDDEEADFAMRQTLGDSPGPGDAESSNHDDGPPVTTRATNETQRSRLPFVQRLMYRRQARENAMLPRREREDMSRFLFMRPGEEIGGDMKVVLPNGDTRYIMVDVHKHKYGSNSLGEHDAFGESGIDQRRTDGSMLSKPFEDLLADLDERRRNERLKALGVGDNTQYSLVSDAALLDGLDSQNSGANDGHGSNADATSTFAGKYAPRQFIDLVSHERTNRLVMQWIMSWRNFVFEGARQTRPDFPVILLAGPPGAGKTTLAHVIARHAGYNPVEINASDERTANVLSNRLINAMEMQSMFGAASGKPNCIILDEFEGVANQGEGRGAVQTLLDMIQAPLSGASKAHPITRPVILICNDPYVAALRPLRRAVKVIFFRAAPQARIVQRLKEIAVAENIAPQHGALELLAERQDYDIRACLNTLQFIVSERGASGSTAQSPRQATQATQRFRLETKDVEDLCVGTKDQTSDLLKSWNAVFQNVRRQRKWTKPGLQSVNEQMRLWAQFGQHVSEFSKFLEGIHENMCGVRLADSSMSNLHEAVNLFCEADVILKRVGESQQWTLSQYLSPTALSLRRLLATESSTFLHFPMAGAANARRLAENKETLAVFAEGRRTLLPGSTIGGRQSLVLDALSPIARMLNPQVRAIPWNLLNPKEQASVQHTLDVMISLGLTLHKTLEDLPFASGKKDKAGRGENGGQDGGDERLGRGAPAHGNQQAGFNPFRRVTYKPEPRIDHLLSFDSETFSYEQRHTPPSLTVCETLIQRLRLARVRDTSSRTFGAGDGIVQQRVSKLSARDKDKALAGKKRGAEGRAPSGAVDFFGRPITAKTAGNRKRIVALKASSDVADGADSVEESTVPTPAKRKKRAAWVEYRFQEGFTNAVRRPVAMDEFLGLTPDLR
ncbi:Replication factor C subunit 1 [Hondaea fermentalgiana]|uniref:Replication factor C subunit 1 n=1 Tax=Hondaea fermentalgiana TaxID=2315210 RepID=A0A2R5GF61_9STRA|nr:Replication factor C subunit 1 [Hondaea fermentalgiana]|eukprot:GBG28378.1 Replication factor C subunit 1 [Hondaea fermentalgiana]